MKVNTYSDLGIKRFHWPVLIKKYDTVKNKTPASPNYFFVQWEEKSDKSDFLEFTLLMRKYSPSKINLFFSFAEMAIC